MKSASMTFTGGFVLLPLIAVAAAFLVGHHLGVKEGIETPRTRATQRYDWGHQPSQAYLQTNVVTTTNVTVIAQ